MWWLLKKPVVGKERCGAVIFFSSSLQVPPLHLVDPLGVVAVVMVVVVSALMD